MHGFGSATTVYDVAQDYDGRDAVALYIGDFDPSGMYMSEEDLPKRLADYGGDHITIKRIALTRKHVDGLPSFPATDKKKDPRTRWFRARYGGRCWELDATCGSPRTDRGTPTSLCATWGPIAKNAGQKFRAQAAETTKRAFEQWKILGERNGTDEETSRSITTLRQTMLWCAELIEK